jgi:hypothetical protein
MVRVVPAFVCQRQKQCAILGRAIAVRKFAIAVRGEHKPKCKPARAAVILTTINPPHFRACFKFQASVSHLVTASDDLGSLVEFWEEDAGIDADTTQLPWYPDLMPNRYRPGEVELPSRECELIARRDDVLGASYRLQYRRPVHFVRGEGMWLYDPDGRAYLDFYNNAPSLGHCHPEVNAAVAEQAGRISANTRYLEPRLVDYAERLVATFPDELDRVVFTCTGSESNDLALRIARFASGSEGVIVSSYAYHGTSAAVAAVSPNLGDAVKLSPFVRIVSLPGPAGLPESQAADLVEAEVRAAIVDLNSRGIGVAALHIDSIFSSDGVWVDPPASSPATWRRCARQVV